MNLDYLNEDLKNLGPLKAAKPKKYKRSYYAIPGVAAHYPPPRLCEEHTKYFRLQQENEGKDKKK
ncbi:MAG: hypothetical protein WCV58_03725 [Patescibacteria group bacterium]|jgi:hypothetical protein